MSDPTAIREDNAIVHSMTNVLGRRLALLQWSLGAFLIIIVAIAIGSILIFEEIATMERNVSALQRSADDVKRQLDRINTMVGGTLNGVTGLLREQDAIEKSLTRIDAARPPQPNPIAPLTTIPHP